MTEVLDRECVVCGQNLTIHVADDGTCEGGHYWANLFKDDDREYWECDDCHTDETGCSPTDDADYQDDAVEIGRNSDHPRLAVQPSPWDPDKLLLWSIHNGEQWTEGTYLRADEARRLADILTTLADELDDSNGEPNEDRDLLAGYGSWTETGLSAAAEEAREQLDDDRSDDFPPGRPDYFDENPGWTDDLPDLGENDE